MNWAPEEVLVAAKTKDVKVKTAESRLVAYTVHKGSYSQLGEVFRKVAGWAIEKGYEVLGPPTSTYYNEAGSVPEDELTTEVQIPVRRSTELYHILEFKTNDGIIVKIRLAKLEDTPSLQRNCFSQRTRDCVMNLLKNDSVEMEKGSKVKLVADVNGEAIGTLSIDFGRDPWTPHVAEISNVIVNRDFRRKGIATKMIESALEIAKEKKIKIVKVEIESKNIAASNLYNKTGFKDYGKLMGIKIVP